MRCMSVWGIYSMGCRSVDLLDNTLLYEIPLERVVGKLTVFKVAYFYLFLVVTLLVLQPFTNWYTAVVAEWYVYLWNKYLVNGVQLYLL